MNAETHRWPPYSTRLLVALALVAANLRMGITSVGPVLDQIRAGTGLSGPGAGVLTSLPVLTFAALGATSPWLARRFGVDRVVAAAMALLAVALVLRVLGGVPFLVTGTVAVCAGIAVANVLLPVVVKTRFPLRIGSVTGVYTAALAGGSALAAGVTAPLETLGGWRLGLAAWALPAALAVVIWVSATVGGRRGASQPSSRSAQTTVAGGSSRRLWGRPRAWAMIVFFGTQSLLAYAAMGWLPAIYRDAGFSTTEAGGLLSLSILVGVPVSFLIPSLAARSSHQRWWALGVTGASLAGLTGLLLSPAAGGWVWAALIGVGNGAFPLALAFFSLRAATTRDTAWLSSAGQSLGYLLAATGPLGVGFLQAVTGGWTAPLLLLIGAMVLQAAAGLVAGRAGHV
ncbi:MFS transporter [Georgenia subflava]|uniref:MFS transporter n=1 Tax=Georgenia subflava TaxID=1622177 RepID=A0A6N7ENY4_9MICO|nr:MFS transporter [Georgenia subflava]MPV38245.1 MFS transporter [Georgenia subflava]